LIQLKTILSLVAKFWWVIPCLVCWLLWTELKTTKVELKGKEALIESFEANQESYEKIHKELVELKRQREKSSRDIKEQLAREPDDRKGELSPAARDALSRLRERQQGGASTP
jgi:hypothetical protein